MPTKLAKTRAEILRTIAALISSVCSLLTLLVVTGVIH